MTSGRKNFTVYKSSAGSGKTYTLVREYLEVILLDPQSYSRILAITFTNKAANEMKDRILRYLKALADPVGHPDEAVIRYLLPELIQDTSLSEEEVRRRASVALKMIMHQYGDFSVSTIDSFFHRVIRTFAYDLKIPMTFQVILEESDVLEEIVRLMLDRTGTDKELTKLLVKFIQSRAEEEQGWDIEKGLVAFSKVLVQESSLAYINRLAELNPSAIADTSDTIRMLIRRIEDRIEYESGAILDMIRSTGLANNVFTGGASGLVSWVEELSERSFGTLVVKLAVRKALEKNVWTSSQSTRAEKASVEGISGELARKTAALVNYIDEVRRRYLTLTVLSQHVFHVAVLGALERELNDYRGENNVLLISEFNRRIYNVVREQPIPFIYERLGEWYQHFFIDEFQDTSILQWHNFLPLLENSLSESRFNMVVGDGKQAIYRFRAGDVRQFEMLPEVMNPQGDPLLQARQMALERNYGLQRMESNFRSDEVVVEFNNRFFGLAKTWLPDHLKTVYSDVRQQTHRKGEGFVRIEFVGRQENGIKYKDLVPVKVLDTVRQLATTGVSLADIAVLCRYNIEASRIASVLLSNDINVVSAESLLLSSSPEVNFLMAWIRWISNPSDEISRHHISWYLTERNNISELDAERTAAELVRKDLYHLIVSLTRSFLPGAGQNPYVLALLDLVLEYTRTDKSSLEDFVEWWDEKGSSKSIVTPEGLDAVRVMTVHKAKGLEFPVVICPYADQQLKPTLSNAWVSVDDPDLSERMPFAYIQLAKKLGDTSYDWLYDQERQKSLVDLLNILYVALTRAQGQLHIFTKEPPRDRSVTDSVPKMFQRFLEQEGTWKEDQLVYLYGTCPPSDSSEKRPGESLPTVPQADFSDWQKRVLLRTTAPEGWEVEEPEKAFTVGNKIHHILSGIMYADDCDASMQDAIKQGIIGNEEYSAIEDLIRNVITDPETSFIFDPAWAVLNEREIIDKQGRIYRPDRLMTRREEAMVIDFKTGRASDRHISQVETYSALVQEMGYNVKGAWILYLGTKNKLVKV